MITREVASPKLKDLFVFKNHKKDLIFANKILEKTEIIGSGKGAIALILKYLKNKKIINNKLDEVFVPDWLGYWVYNQVHEFAFPVKKISEKTKVLFAYHQYGFPQDMDKILEFAKEKNLIVIEDCAHAIDSYYKGKRLGTFGDFTIYSFSKWFFCFALGGVNSKFDDFQDYAKKEMSSAPLFLTLIKDLSKILYEKNAKSNNNFLKKYYEFFTRMSYSIYSNALKPTNLAKRLLFFKIENEINIRQKRYRYFLDKTKDLKICGHLEKEGITPYLIPIRYPESKSEKLIKELSKINISAGIYHFDINRNLLSPNFVKCVCLPCHGGMSDEKFNDMVEIIIKI
ncbi:MAG: DegT/DnrJ/EryC1/StrS family aminotransferase [Candidatus Falkowbacteria bacterium]